MASTSARIALQNLRQTLRRIEPAALVVEPRIMRRVIRLDRRLAGLGLFVPHRHCYTIDRDRLLAFVDRSELDLPAGAELPQTAILIERHAEDENFGGAGGTSTGNSDAILRRYWRLLFHAQVHIEFEHRIADELSPLELTSERRQVIGDAEFAEVRAVLLKDEYLFPKPTDLETYVEFAAVYLELRYFAPQLLPQYFPAIRDWHAIERLVSSDVCHSRLFEISRPGDISAIAPPESDAAATIGLVLPAAGPNDATPSPSRSAKLLARAQRAAELGNSVKAAILTSRAALASAPHSAGEMRAAAGREMAHLASRLKQSLNLAKDEASLWTAALAALLPPAAAGFWSVEARLLYDLQKACIEQERGVFKLDLIEWCLKRGRRPMQRPLPLLREVLIVKHLRTAQRRLRRARLTPAIRDRLSVLLATALANAELRLRERVRPRIVQALDDVALVPQDVPEEVARRKVVEELLDRIVEHGFLSMSDVRDALSKNDLKLPDLAGPEELWRGDQLLRVDRKLGHALDGVYRPGTVYLRWPQRLSSLAFGTQIGRFLTKYVAIPYGGTFLVLFFIRYELARILRGKPIVGVPTNAELVGGETPSVANHVGDSSGAIQTLVQHHPVAGSWWVLWIAVVLAGTWVLLLIQHPPFRAWCWEMVRRTGRGVRRILVELPTGLIQLPLVQKIINSPIYAALCSYVLRPALITFCVSLVPWCFGFRWNVRTLVELFLLIALTLNSPIGRFADEWLTDMLGRLWYELRMRVFAALFQWIMDAFHSLMVGLERVMYTVDEWLRFRVGDQRAARAVKLIGGAGWFFISYVTLFVFTLLVEPQINPIKHFPVVTVAHKVVALGGKFAVDQLTPFLGEGRAFTLVISTIWLIPGVFGFLVWELRENWRLYAANRAKVLRAVPIGNHGETMVRLLRPGFHSGTLPKAYAKLRHALVKAELSGDQGALVGKEGAIAQVADAVRHFVERDLIALVEEGDVVGDNRLSVGQVRTATNRIEVELFSQAYPGQPAWLVWEESAGRLTMTVSRAGWLDLLSSQQSDAMVLALSGLAQRSGTDDMPGPWCGRANEPSSWTDWIRNWPQPAAAEANTSPDDTSPDGGPPTLPLRDAGAAARREAV